MGKYQFSAKRLNTPALLTVDMARDANNSVIEQLQNTLSDDSYHHSAYAFDGAYVQLEDKDIGQVMKFIREHNLDTELFNRDGGNDPRLSGFIKL
jgi:hypothetical protein